MKVSTLTPNKAFDAAFLKHRPLQPFIDLVDKILEAKKEGKNTKLLEKKIDQLVYKLYDLTEDEIKIVETK